MFELYRRVKHRARAVGRRVQAAVVRWTLYVVYFAGIGSVHLWVRACHRHLLEPPGKQPSWEPSCARGFDESDSQRQS